jgi:thymidylate synthase
MLRFDRNFNHPEEQYIQLIKDIIAYGEFVDGRNGRTKTLIGSSMHFPLSNNTIPLLTTKKVAWKTCLKELIWFINGSTDNKKLKSQNVKIWNGNSTKDFLEQNNLPYEEDDLGPVYGHQWRHFNADYIDCNTDYSGKGVDQLSNIVEILKDKSNRSSRRIILSSWNPQQINKMALPPCHILAQFNVVNNKLSCSMYQRSCDIGLGVPFNIASYSFLTHILAKHCDLEAGDFYYHLGNTHIYDDHIEKLKLQVEKSPFEFPKIYVKNKKDNINDYTIEDIVIDNYKSHESIKMIMRP